MPTRDITTKALYAFFGFIALVMVWNLGRHYLGLPAIPERLSHAIGVWVGSEKPDCPPCRERSWSEVD